MSEGRSLYNLCLWLFLVAGFSAYAQDKLTAKPWHLYQKRLDEKKSLLYKATDENFVYTFYPNGRLILQRYHAQKTLEYQWHWINQHRQISVNKKDSASLSFEVVELSSKKLILSIEGKTFNAYEFTFKHADDPQWLLEDVKGKNATRSDSVLRTK